MTHFANLDICRLGDCGIQADFIIADHEKSPELVGG